MTRRALLIGTGNGLAGSTNDVRAMAAILRPRGFRIKRLVTPDATRAAILDAYERLIAEAKPADAFVVYYSGHGGLAQSPSRPDLQFIAPDDYAESTDADFRGITNVELSVLLARLTSVAPNTTVIIDCCHAGHLVRRPDLQQKSLSRPAHWLPSYDTVQEHIARLVDAGLRVRLRPLESSPHAVRVVACAPRQAAWEFTNRDRVVMGLFTDTLTRALHEADGLRISWSTLVDAVRRDVQTFTSSQRPEVEGPAGRQPFETTELGPLLDLPVVALGRDRVELLGASLLGVELGDEFAIMPAGATGPRDGPALGTATVDQVLPVAARARLRSTQAGQEIPVDARAHRVRAAAAALPVRLPVGHPATPALLTAMARNLLLRKADSATDQNVTAEVVTTPDGRLVVRDDAGPLHPPYSAQPAGIDALMGTLQRIAQATALRRLAGDPARPLDHRVQVEWGRVRDGRMEPLPASGALLFAHADEHVYFRLHNDGDRPCYASLIDLGLAHRIDVLTTADLSGVLLAPGAGYTYGWSDADQRVTGAPVTWPAGADTSVSRLETVVVLISDEPVDVSVLCLRKGRDTKDADSMLGQLLEQIATGTSREVGTPPSGQVRFDVRQIEFVVSPMPPPATEA